MNIQNQFKDNQTRLDQQLSQDSNKMLKNNPISELMLSTDNCILRNPYSQNLQQKFGSQNFREDNITKKIKKQKGSQQKQIKSQQQIKEDEKKQVSELEYKLMNIQNCNSSENSTNDKSYPVNHMNYLQGFIDRSDRQQACTVFLAPQRPLLDYYQYRFEDDLFSSDNVLKLKCGFYNDIKNYENEPLNAFKQIICSESSNNIYTVYLSDYNTYNSPPLEYVVERLKQFNTPYSMELSQQIEEFRKMKKNVRQLCKNIGIKFKQPQFEDQVDLNKIIVDKVSTSRSLFGCAWYLNKDGNFKVGQTHFSKLYFDILGQKTENIQENIIRNGINKVRGSNDNLEKILTFINKTSIELLKKYNSFDGIFHEFDEAIIRDVNRIADRKKQILEMHYEVKIVFYNGFFICDYSLDPQYHSQYDIEQFQKNGLQVCKSLEQQNTKQFEVISNNIQDLTQQEQSFLFSLSQDQKDSKYNLNNQRTQLKQSHYKKIKKQTNTNLRQQNQQTQFKQIQSEQDQWQQNMETELKSSNNNNTTTTKNNNKITQIQNLIEEQKESYDQGKLQNISIQQQINKA